jgi:pyruvate dehydrogenase E1 component alpha subunit
MFSGAWRDSGGLVQLLDLYHQMARARAFEVVLAGLWRQGLISGEMHLGTGEEAVAAGVVTHLREGDGLALDHRATPELVVRGVSLEAMLREMLGREDGLCRGRGGHMHLFSRPHLAASSGIVGASAPLGAGFALAAQQRRRGAVAAAFFGEGALNQGMVMESLNLAAVWSLPLVMVCKDNDWAITTRSSSVTAGTPAARARSFGIPTTEVDGLDVQATWRAARVAVERGRRGRGPSFLHCRCPRLDGHYLGDQLVRTAKSPLGEGKDLLGKVVGAAISGSGGGLGARASGVFGMVKALARARWETRDGKEDPLSACRRALEREHDAVERIDRVVAEEVSAALQHALDETPGNGDA